MVSTLLWCLVAYDVRVAPSIAIWGEIETDLYREEEAVVRAISEGLKLRRRIICNVDKS